MAVIMVSHFFPFPARVGAEIRTAIILKTLSELTEVILISGNDGSGDVQEAKKYAGEVISVAPLGFGKVKSILRRLKEPFTAFPAAGRWLNLAAFRKSIYSVGNKHNDALLWLEASWLLDAVSKDEKREIVLDQHNLDSEVLKKRAQNARFPLSVLYNHDYLKQKTYEKQALKKASVIMSVSEEEKKLHEKLFQLDNVVVLPNLLELEKYKYSAPNYDSRTIIMTGDFAYEPNRVGAHYLVKKILPLVREQVHNPKIVFAGKGSGSLPLCEDGVELLGEFDKPEDVFSLASAAVAPIFTGGGSRYKILEALAFGVPVVSTTCGAEGLGLMDGDGLLIRDGDRQFAGGLSSILNGRELAAELSFKGRKKIEEHYSMDRCKAIISSAMKNLGYSIKCA
jgi:polysaccharide biosynthesis protein PslH